MKSDIDPIARTLGIPFFFLIVTVMGFIAARWRRPKTLAHRDEGGLGGCQCGTWISRFIVGGDFHTG
jgi:SSS family solute:Na+ symporter